MLYQNNLPPGQQEEYDQEFERELRRRRPESQLSVKMRDAIRSDDLNGLGKLIAEAASAGGTEEDAVEDRWGETPLMFAARWGRLAAVEALLALPVSTTGDQHGQDAFFHAVMGGHVEIAQLLQERVGRKNTDRRGQTPLMAAAKHAQKNCVAWLLEFEDANATDTDGCTALMHAATSTGDHPEETIAFLLPVSDGSKKEALEDRTALHLAVTTDNANIVSLVAQASDLNARNKWNETPLEVAVAAGWQHSANAIGAEIARREQVALLEELKNSAPESAHGAPDGAAPSPNRRGPKAL